MGPEVPSRARRALPALCRSEKEDGRRPPECLVNQRILDIMERENPNILVTRNSDGLRPSSFSLLQRAGRALPALLGTSG